MTKEARSAPAGSGTDSSWYEIVGTSHIASQAVRRVKAAFADFVPDVVALELDQGRLAALLADAKPRHGPGMIRIVGVRGYLFALLASWLQRRLGRIVNMTPGVDMLAAFKEAHRAQKRVLLIDQDIRRTLRRLSKALGWRELRQALADAWNGILGRETVRFDLRGVPSEALVARLLGEFRRRYPRPYKVLVEERNRHMARALLAYHERFPEQKVLVVVGAGHKAGMKELLERGTAASHPSSGAGAIGVSRS